MSDAIVKAREQAKRWVAEAKRRHPGPLFTRTQAGWTSEVTQLAGRLHDRQVGDAG
jgi:hypothetical protein